MEVMDRSRSPSRRTSRVEQVVGRWLRRSRDSSSRERTLGDGRPGEPGEAGEHAGSGGSDQRNIPIRITLQVPWDPVLQSHGFRLSTQTPVQVQEVSTGGPADGRLAPGDQVQMINNITMEDLPTEQAVDIIRDCQESVTLTILRHIMGPKSSFITAEKRARLKINPVKVRFAEEVVVNGHSQGNSLLFLPNVLKVYLENGQTKAFKFEAKTTVKDIVLTLKEKLSIHCIEFFALMLEQHYSVSKLFLLHEDELIRQVVQKREPHDYRCLFRVCFMPKEPLDVLQQDPVAFEYFYLQSVNDVLQERFAVEMKCNTALRLAALHLRERLLSSGQTHKASLKSIRKNWGIESFVSPTLLRNMKDKDLMKSLSFHLKKTQDLEARSKVISATEARLNYLTELAELKCFGSKSFSATMMLQDRESMVCLLVGAKYGISHLINHKHHITATLTEFSSISHVELLPESEKVSLVKIYLQDIKPMTLMLECQAAKELSCLVAGYCKLLVDPALSVFSWDGQLKEHRISAEEGYVSRGCSDSEESSEMDGLDALVSSSFSMDSSRAGITGAPAGEELGQEVETGGGQGDAKEWQNRVGAAWEMGALEERANDEEREMVKGYEGDEALSEASDSCRTESRFISSCSSDSMDALEEDDLEACSSSDPCRLQGHSPCRLSPAAEQARGGSETPCQSAASQPTHADGDIDASLCYAQLSQMAHCLPSPPEASEEEEDASSWLLRPECVFTFEERDARHYYSICSGVTPDSARSLSGERPDYSLGEREAGPVPILQPPPGFQDSSSEDEFFDAHDRLSSPEFAGTKDVATDHNTETGCTSRKFPAIDVCIHEGEQTRKHGDALRKKCRKRRSFLDSDHTSRVSWPHQATNSRGEDDELCCFDTTRSAHSTCPTVSSLSDAEGEPAQLESKPIPASASSAASSQKGMHKNKQLSSSLIEMEPDTMEFKSVTELVTAASPIIQAVRCRVEPEGKESNGKQKGDGDCATGVKERLFSHHVFNSQTSSGATHCAVPDGTTGPIFKAVKDMMEENNKATLTGQMQGQEPGAGGPGDRSPTLLFSREDGAQEFGLTTGVFEAQPRCPVLAHTAQMPASHKTKEEGQCKDCDEKVRFNTQDLCEGTRAITIQRNISHSLESLTSIGMDDFGCSSSNVAITMIGATPKEMGSFNFQGCTTALVGRLSTSTIRGKIQNLPWLLSRSQEALISKRECSLPRCAVMSRRATEVGEQATETAEITGTEGSDEEADDVTLATEEVLESFEVTDVRPDGCVLADLKSEACLLNKSVFEAESLLTLHHHMGSTTQSGEGILSRRTALTEYSDPSGEIHRATEHCKSTQPQPQAYRCPQGKATMECHPLDQGCPATLQEPQMPPETCGCQTVYTNCFRGVLDRNGFDEELTVYEFSCRAQGIGGGSRLNTPSVTFSSPLSSISSSSRSILVRSSSTDLSPLMSPLEPLDSLEDTLNQLRNRHYRLPGGFLLLQQDVGGLLTLLDRAPPGRGQHHQETCFSHFSENKQLLRAESRKLMSLCQRVIRVGQSPDEILQALAESFRTLVQLASVCLWFSSCCRCQRRHTEVMENLRDITRTYEEFAQVAEKASGRRSCHDIVIKLLARQCTSLTAAVFCLTQLFRTITDL